MKDSVAVSNMIQNLKDSGLVNILISLQKGERVSRNAQFTASLSRLYRFLLVSSFVVTLIVNSSLWYWTLGYWVAVSIVTVLINLVISKLINRNLFCKGPLIDFVVANNAEQVISTTYEDYTEMYLPTVILLRILMRTVPVFKKDPFFITIDYLGLKHVYRFDGKCLRPDIYDKIIKGKNIFINDGGNDYSEKDYYT